jgi:hypothetical protein
MVMPNIGSETGGDGVTLTGSDFTDAVAVLFGTQQLTQAVNMVVLSDSQITCTTPAGTGTVDVTVQAPSGDSTLVGGFAYSAPAPDAPAYPPPEVSAHGLCSACLYWDQAGAGDPAGEQGLCRHDPPQVPTARGAAPRGTTVWPITQSADWCGGFEPIPPPS